jgi:nucleotide-binding universal stress UspA family protein
MHQALHPVHDVLLATDFSAGAEAAAHAALDYAQALGARLHLLHVAPDPASVDAAAERVAALGRALGGVPVVKRVETGRPADKILEYAAAQEVGLIVLGRHGRTGSTPALLGSVAEETMRGARCPVLAVPAPSAEVEEQPAPAAAAERAGRRSLRCLVCTKPAAELICESCRARIRGEALQQKWQVQGREPRT